MYTINLVQFGQKKEEELITELGI